MVDACYVVVMLMVWFRFDPCLALSTHLGAGAQLSCGPVLHREDLPVRLEGAGRDSLSQGGFRKIRGVSASWLSRLGAEWCFAAGWRLC